MADDRPKRAQICAAVGGSGGSCKGSLLSAGASSGEVEDGSPPPGVHSTAPDGASEIVEPRGSNTGSREPNPGEIDALSAVRRDMGVDWELVGERDDTMESISQQKHREAVASLLGTLVYVCGCPFRPSVKCGPLVWASICTHSTSSVPKLCNDALNPNPNTH